MTLWIAVALAGGLDEAALLSEVAPLVEAATGHALGTPPPLEIVTTTEMARLVSREQMGLAHLLYPELDTSALVAIGRVSAWTGSAVAGKYGLFDQTLYVSRDHVTSWVRRLKREGVELDAAAVAKCILAHELTHALHARSGAFEATARLRDEEALIALNAVSEGYATAIHEVVCPQVGAEAMVEPLSRALGVGTEGSPYGAGRAFVAHHAPHVWDVLERPPRSTRTVLHPESYGQPLPEPPADAPARRAAEALGSGVVFVKRASYQGLAGTLAVDADARKALEAMREGISATSSWRSGAIEVSLLDFQTPEQAEAFVSEARKPMPPGDGWLPVYEEAPRAVEAGAGGFVADYTIRDTRSGYPSLTRTRYVAWRGQWVGTVEIAQTSRRQDKVLEVLDAMLDGL